MNDKVLLCRPKGGLNDMLVQVVKCWNYSIETSRSLVVDSTESGFLDTLDKYFIPEAKTDEDVAFSIDESFLTWADSVSCYPPDVEGVVSDYSAIYKAGEGYIHSVSGRLLTFDFEKEYDETLLLHHRGGGGKESVSFFGRVKCTPELQVELKNRLPDLSRPYEAVHVRNTDYKTDYKKFFSDIKLELEGKRVLICSDDSDCIDYAKRFFQEVAEEIFTVSDVPETGGKKLHGNKDIDRWAANVDCLLDLFSMASAEKVHFTRVSKGNISGFSQLAKTLSKQGFSAKNLYL